MIDSLTVIIEFSGPINRVREQMIALGISPDAVTMVPIGPLRWEEGRDWWRNKPRRGGHNARTNSEPRRDISRERGRRP